jgi:protein-S-isoprenylcysteine O-methyltransferase Ste14
VRPARRLGALAAACWALAATPAAAGMADIRRSDNALELGLGATYLDYREKVGGSTLDSE